MEKFEITKDDIIKLSAFGGNTEATLKQWFPDAFKTELEVGIWYKTEDNWLFNYQKDCNVYGFSPDGWNYCSCSYWSWTSDNTNGVLEATHQEVETALIAEAKKRGFEEGNYKCLLIPEKTHLKCCEFSFEDNTLFLENKKGFRNVIFKDGKWATIIPQPLTLEERVANLEKKLSCNQE